MRHNEFSKSVLEHTGKTAYEVELEVAIGLFINHRDLNPEQAWGLAWDFMIEMQRFYQHANRIKSP